MSTLVRVTVAQDISGLVDLRPGESPWHESVFTVRPGTAFETPDELEEYAVACTQDSLVLCVVDALGRITPPEPWMNDEPESFVMAHFSEDV